MGTLRTGRCSWLLAGLVLTGMGCNRQDTERLARIGRKTVERTEALTGNVRDSLTNGWQGVCSTTEETGLEARVATRLRWERSLADVKIDVKVKDSTIELRGNVSDLTKRRRAVALAESTIGVEKVVDLLQMPPTEP
jgi:hyperosmotically inducible periplasmic protein